MLKEAARIDMSDSINTKEPLQKSKRLADSRSKIESRKRGRGVEKGGSIDSRTRRITYLHTFISYVTHICILIVIIHGSYRDRSRCDNGVVVLSEVVDIFEFPNRENFSLAARTLM